MKRVGLLGIVVVLAIGLISCQQQGERLRFATGGTTGTYYAFGTAIAQVLSERLQIAITVESTGASRANIQFIDAKESELALVQNDVADYAYRGVDMFQAEGRITSFSAIAALYPEVIQIIANPAAGINSISDLRGKRVSVGDAGSGTEFNSQQILNIHGITFADIQRQNLGFGASADAFKDGRLDAFFVVAGPPTPAIVDLAITHNIVLLGFEPAAIDRLMQQYPVYAPFTITPNSYSGQASPVETVSVKASLIVANSVSEDTVYRLTKGLFEHRQQIAQGHARGNDIDPAYAVQGIPFPFHPGAEKYFREIGLK